MWAWLISFFTNKALPEIKHAIWRTISVICVLLVVGGLIWSVYITMVKPHTKPTPTQQQQAGTINNTTYNYTIKPTFGCMRIPK